jgi:preprotein translocase subunit SecF
MFNFLRYHKIAALFSIALIGAGICLYVQQGGFRYSVDFTGGTEVRVRFANQEDTAAIKDMVAKEWNGSVYNILEANEIIVRVQDTPETLENLDQKILTSINNVSVDNPGTLLQTNSISDSVGQTLRSKSIFAILMALLLMLIYITLRFKLAFAVGAVVAILHDALAILACFLILNNEISIDVIGAILATLGYSINDTIVIFTRIRKNLKTMKGKSIGEVVNVSLNQTLRRTLLTSLSTALVVGSQFAFGGATIRSLSLALLLGIIFGTFSSIFIASPTMMLLFKEEK